MGSCYCCLYTDNCFCFWWFFLIINSLYLKIVLWHACAQQTIIHWFFWKDLRLCNWFQSSVVFLGMLLTRKERSLNITQKHQSVVRKRCHKNLYDTYKRFFKKILTFIALKLGHIRHCIWSLAIRWSWQRPKAKEKPKAEGWKHFCLLFIGFAKLLFASLLVSAMFCYTWHWQGDGFDDGEDIRCCSVQYYCNTITFLNVPMSWYVPL